MPMFNRLPRLALLSPLAGFLSPPSSKIGSETFKLTLVDARSAASWSSFRHDIESARLNGTSILICGGGEMENCGCGGGGGGGDDSLEGERGCAPDACSVADWIYTGGGDSDFGTNTREPRSSCARPELKGGVTGDTGDQGVSTAVMKVCRCCWPGEMGLMAVSACGSEGGARPKSKPPLSSGGEGVEAGVHFRPFSTMEAELKEFGD
jgi:hypothetical protein